MTEKEKKAQENQQESKQAVAVDIQQLKDMLLDNVKAEIRAELETAREAEAELPKPKRDAAEAWLNEYVTIELFKDNERYKDDVFVQIGGEACLIQRGKQVRVKRKFALLLEQSRRQAQAAADMQIAEAARAAEKLSMM